MSNDAPTPISDDEVVALAKAAFEHSRSDISQRAAAESAPRELQQQQPGITIDLGHKNISRLPDEVIDVIRAEIERCASPFTARIACGFQPGARHTNMTLPGLPSPTIFLHPSPSASLNASVSATSMSATMLCASFPRPSVHLLLYHG
jgi:hypothetical protein